MENVVFKTVTRGFAKDEVMAYIAKLDAELERTRAAAQTAENGARQSADAMRGELSARDNNAATLAAQLSEEHEQNTFLTESVNKLGGEIAELKKQVEEAALAAEYQEREIADLQRKNNELTDELTKNDDASKQIGDAIIEAHQIAKEIVTKAEERAKQITGNAQLVVARIAEDIGGFRSELETLRETIATNTGAMQNRLTAMCGAIDDTQRLFVERFSDGK